MYVRVVRFTDVTPDRVEGLLARSEQEGGPPPGIPAKGLQMLFDADQGTAVVLQHFDSAEEVRTGAEGFAAMDPGETPGTRVSRRERNRRVAGRCSAWPLRACRGQRCSGLG